MPVVKKKEQTSNSMFNITAEYVEPTYTFTKAYRAEELEKSVVEHNGHLFNADERSMDRIDRLVDIANFKYNQAIYQGLSANTAYESVYQNQYIPWKTDDNQFIQVNIETLASVQEKALTKMSELWVKWG
jgi:hypothetical protein